MIHHQLKSRNKHRRIISTVLLFVLCVSSLTHESYSLSNDIGYNDAHVIRGQEPNKHRNQRRNHIVKHIVIACCATGVICWVLSGVTNNIAPIESRTYNTSSSVNRNNAIDIRELTLAQRAQFFAPRPPPLTPEEQKLVDAYMISCRTYAHQAIQRPKLGPNDKIGRANDAVKEAYVRGMELPSNVASLVEDYAWEMAPERKKAILWILEHDHQPINTIDVDELIVPLISDGTTGLHMLLTKYAKSNDREVRQNIVHTIRSIVQKYPTSINMRTSLHNKETFCHVVAKYSVFDAMIDHDLFDIFIKYGNPRWDMTNDLHYDYYDEYKKGSHCLALLVQHEDLKFHQDAKGKQKDENLLRKLALTCPIDDQDQYGQTALHHAIRFGASEEIINFLVNDLKANPCVSTFSYTYKDRDMETWHHLNNTINPIITIPLKNALVYAQEYRASKAVILMLEKATTRLEQKEKKTETIKGLDE